MTDVPDIPGIRLCLLDRAYILTDLFDRTVLDTAVRLRAHNAISEERFEQIEALSDALAQLYQDIGRDE